MLEIKGIVPAILTPFDKEEKINENELRNQINRMINAGVHGIFSLGTNGEFFTLTYEEKIKIMEIVVDEVNGRVPVYAGTGCITTKETIMLSKEAEKAGVDAISVITPYFAAISQEEIYQHYYNVAEAISLPVIVYNIPARTGTSISPETIARLSKINNIKAVKDSSGNFDNMLQYIEKTKDEDFVVLSGNDSLILWNLLAGGSGAVTGVANIYPETMVSIYNLWKTGKLTEARAKQDSIRPIRNCLKLGNPNTIVKKATQLLGYNTGECRAPFNHITEEAIVELKRTMEIK